jgi:D-xylose transport system ATP-binding protein
MLVVENWGVKSETSSRQVCHNISLSAFKGEILGVSGLMGSGRSELFMNLLGLSGRKVGGSLKWQDKELNLKSANDATRHGLALVTEDRKRFGLVLEMDLRRNCSLASLERMSHGWTIDSEREIQLVSQLVEDLHIKTPSLEQKVGNLSGGNQQKIVLAKWLLTNPKLLILDEPTRGIDVGARYEIYKIMNDLVDRGVVVIMISSDLAEIIGMSDRILVFHEGRIAGELSADEASAERIMTMATGSSNTEL